MTNILMSVVPTTSVSTTSISTTNILTTNIPIIMGAPTSSEPTLSFKMTIRPTTFTSLTVKPTLSPAVLITLILKNMNFKRVILRCIDNFL